MIGSLSKTKEILQKYNLRAKKNFGQNFLIDSNIINNIIDASEISEYDGVLEIGPGIGSMTEMLVKKAKKVICYEIDSDMIEVLKNEIKTDNLIIKQNDFLKVNLTEEMKQFDDCKKVFVVSNLPYYITTPIIFKLLEQKTNIDSMYFMVQKEVGLRLTGKPKTKDYNSLSVLMDLQTNSKILFNVSRNCFYPAPEVDSVIILVKRVEKDYSLKDRSNFLKFVQSIFEMRRKTLLNNIIHKYNISKEKVIESFNCFSFSESIRAEELTVGQIVDLYNYLF